MTSTNYNNLWRSDLYNTVSAKDRVQSINLNHLKLKGNDAYEKDEKKTRNLEPHNIEDVENKAYIYTEIS